MPVDVLADISDAVSKVPIEIDEEYFQALCEKSTDRALPGSAWAATVTLRAPQRKGHKLLMFVPESGRFSSGFVFMEAV